MNLMIRRMIPRLMIRTIPVMKVGMILVVTIVAILVAKAEKILVESPVETMAVLAMKKKIPAQKSRRKEADN